jgi:ketosteroid isomerase-like protein
VGVIDPIPGFKEERMNRSSKWLKFGGMLVLIAMTSCQPAPRVILSRTVLAGNASAFETLARAQVEAWNQRDNQALRKLYHPDAVMFDRTFGDHAVGIDAIVAVLNNMTVTAPKWQATASNWFIGKEGGLAIDPLWDFAIGGYAFSQKDLMIDVDWMQTQDGLVSLWTVFYGLDALEKINMISAAGMSQAKSLLTAYQDAWSGGNPAAVGDLYASDAAREDSLYGEIQQGREEITSFAKSFFAWYPGAPWGLSLAFGEGQGDSPMIGGLFNVLVKDTRGQPCAIQAAVLLQAVEGKITHETIYYQPDSLILCGWSQ